jgi:ribosomal protein S18 acetylase RimI-like enzyme
LKEDGVKFGQLEADATNEPALNLYKKYGFETQYEQEYYAWRVE